MNRLSRLPPTLVTALATLLLCLQWWMGVSATREICSTTDELAHVAGGFSYWAFDDYRLQPENGNLPQRLAALPWVLAGGKMSTVDTKSWGNSNVWIIGHDFLYGPGNVADTDYLLFLSRATMALMGVALGVLIFAWSRRLWGDSGALFSLGLYTFCPNFLANAPLATSDVTMAFFLLAACGAFWRHTRVLDWKSGALSAATVALACVAKFSFVLLLPIFALLVAARMASGEPLVLNLGARREIAKPAGKLVALSISGLVHGLVAWVVIWAFFGFRYSPVGPEMPGQVNFFAAWDIVMPASGFWHTFFSVTRGMHLLPEAYLQGFAYVLEASQARGAFLNGDYSLTGWVHFFPYTFLVKTPLPQLAAFALAGCAAVAALAKARPGAAAWARVRGALYRVAPLAALFCVYWAFSLASHLNIGHRHILPTYPVLFIAAGLLLRTGAGRWLVGAGLALAAWTAVQSAGIRPHYLAFFNAFAGGPENGWRHLVDSSLDWGQDLPGLSKWLYRNEQPNEQIYVSYSGSGDLEHEGIRALELAPVYNFDRVRKWFALEAGIYAIGATNLQDTYGPWRGPWSLEKERNYLALRNQLSVPLRDATDATRNERSQQLFSLDQLRYSRLCHFLRFRKPDAVIGYTIFIYRLTSEEVRIAEFGSLTELSDAMGRALEARGP